MSSFSLVDAVHHPPISFLARVFDKQEGYRFTYANDGEKKFIETGAYLHWCKGKIIDVALDLSCMSGCAYSCKFCASSKYNHGFLTENEIIQQVRMTLELLRFVQADFIDKCPKFTFSFQGMGEPSIPNVSKNIVSSIKKIRSIFQPNTGKTVQFTISTIGAYPAVIRKWAEESISLETLQLSLHASSDEKRREIIGEEVPDIAETFDALAYFASRSPNTLIKINYLLIKTDTFDNNANEDLDRLLSLLKDTQYKLKLSHLNETASSKSNKIKGASVQESTNSLHRCNTRLSPSNVYEYGSKDNLRISCGQLASYAEHAYVIDNYSQERIHNIYEELIEQNVVMFLGAGVTRNLWDAKDLAQELFNELVIDGVYSHQMGLQGVADIYYARNKVDKLYNKLNNTIRTREVPSEFVELTRYPWKAIYTTNYDDFLERAYVQSQNSGLTNYSCSRITKISDLEKRASPQAIPVIKLHGCIQEGIGAQVISSSDYMQLYLDLNRQALLQRLSTDVMQYCIVFAGYSMNDAHIAKILYDANKAKSPLKVKGYLVSPKKDVTWEADYEKMILDKFHLELIRCTFEDFLTELSRLRRKLKVFVSGSIKQTIPGLDKVKEDVTEWATDFLYSLGDKLKQQGILVRTAATATDKAGYIVAKRISNNKRTNCFDNNLWINKWHQILYMDKRQKRKYNRYHKQFF